MAVQNEPNVAAHSGATQAPSGPADGAAVAAGNAAAVLIQAPAAGQRVDVAVQAGEHLVLQGVDLSGAQVQEVSGGLQVALVDGGTIFLDGFAAAAQDDHPPVVEIPGIGTIDAGQFVAAAAAGGVFDVAPAAGPGGGVAHGGGAAFAHVDPGDIGHGLTPGGLLPNDDFFRAPGTVETHPADGGVHVAAAAAAGPTQAAQGGSDTGSGGFVDTGTGGGDTGGQGQGHGSDGNPGQGHGGDGNPGQGNPGGGGAVTGEGSDTDGVHVGLTTNSDQTDQLVTMTLSQADDPTHSVAHIYELNAQGQQGTAVQDTGFTFDPSADHNVVLEASAGTKAIVTDFSVEGVVVQGSGNAALEINDNSNTHADSTAITAVVNPDGAGLVQGPTQSTDGNAGHNTLDAPADGLVHYLYGGSGDDTLNGGDGTDVLNGGSGTDTLNGGAGNDILVYHAGDTIDGGTGFDLLRVDDGALQLTEGGSGANTLNLTGAIDLALNANVDLHGQAISNVEGILITEEAGTSTSGADPNDAIGTTISLNAEDVLNFTDDNNTLHIFGSPGDVVDLGDAGNWTAAAPPADTNFTAYTCHVGDVAATVLVEADVHVAFNGTIV